MKRRQRNVRNVMFCASCDRCRARKTRCDGNRPCASCKIKYMRIHKLTPDQLVGIDIAEFGCIYSPARRRGPVPVMNNSKKYDENIIQDGETKSSSDDSVNNNSDHNNHTQHKKARRMRRRSSSHESLMRGSVTGNRVNFGDWAGSSHGGGFSLHNNDYNFTNSLLSAQSAPENTNDHNKCINSLFSADLASDNNNIFPLPPPLDPTAAAMQNHVISTLISMRKMGNNNMSIPFSNAAAGMAELINQHDQEDVLVSAQSAAQKQLAYVQQLQIQHQIMRQNNRRRENAAALAASQNSYGSGNSFDSFDLKRSQHSSILTHESGPSTDISYDLLTHHMEASYGSGNKIRALLGDNNGHSQSMSRRPTVMHSNTDAPSLCSTSSKKRVIGCTDPKVLQFLPLINLMNPTGMHLRACHTLSAGGLFGLLPIPSDEEYCNRFDSSLKPQQLPQFDVAALQAARFGELAMGALATMKVGDMELMSSLANASVLCLKSCVEEQIHPSLMLYVARTFFFHSILRLYMGELEGYFKYRRFCLHYLSQMDGIPGVNTLMAAISFQDSLLYMLFNASEDLVPNIDEIIPRVSELETVELLDDEEKKYGIGMLPSCVASNPMNQFWIQGVPPIFINEKASSQSRVLDAFACAIRSDVDKAKSREKVQTTRTGRVVSRKQRFLLDADAEAKERTATECAVDFHDEELSCTSILVESSILIAEDEHSSLSHHSIFSGLRLLKIALDVVLNTEPESLDIQSIFSVLEIMMEQPILLFQGGPTYHIINSCTILLAYKINKLQSNDLDSALLLHKALDIYNGSRMTLEKHRSKLPRRLQCRKLPTPSPSTIISGGPVIDLSGVSTCMSLNLQDGACNDVYEEGGSNSLKQSKMQTSKSDELYVNDKSLLTMCRMILKEN